MPLKIADLYEYDGELVAFLAYLDPKNSPIAFCVTLGTGDTAWKAERRHGLHAVYWSGGPQRFLAIGHAPDAELQATAATLQERFSKKQG